MTRCGPCYHYVTASDGMVLSRHHRLTAAHRAVRSNTHVHVQALAMYLPRSLPIRVGDAVPDNAQARPLPLKPKARYA